MHKTRLYMCVLSWEITNHIAMRNVIDVMRCSSRVGSCPSMSRAQVDAQILSSFH